MTSDEYPYPGRPATELSGDEYQTALKWMRTRNANLRAKSLILDGRDAMLMSKSVYDVSIQIIRSYQ